MAGSQAARSIFTAWALGAAAIGLVAMSGCHPPFQWRGSDPLSRLPPALPATPTLADLTRTVNANASQIRTFSCSDATLSGTNFPALRATISFERPQRLRIRGNMSLVGAMLDVGSNDDLFWFWAKPNQPPGVYFCRHDDYASNAQRQPTPIDPYWLLEALGLAEFPANLQHAGPYPLSGNRWAIQTLRQTPDGPATKVTIVDGRLGLVLEQRVFDAQKQLIAAALCGKYHQDPTSKLFMPTSVKIQSPARGKQPEFSLRIEMPEMQINRELPGGAALWQMPAIDGAPPINLCQGGAAAPGVGATLPTGATQPVGAPMAPQGAAPAAVQPAQAMPAGQAGYPNGVQSTSPGVGATPPPYGAPNQFVPGAGYRAPSPVDGTTVPSARVTPAPPTASRPYWRG